MSLLFIAAAAPPVSSAASPPFASVGQQREVPTSVSVRFLSERGGVAIGDENVIAEGTVEASGDVDAVPSGNVHLVVGEIEPTDAPSASVGADGRFTLPAFSLPALPEDADPFPVAVAYEGDGTFAPSMSEVTPLQVYESDPAITLTSETNPARLGDVVMFRAQVSYREAARGQPPGSVAFSVDGIVDGASASALVPVDQAGAAEWEAALPIGSHVVSADYVPAEGDLTSSHAEIEQDVMAPSKMDAELTIRPVQTSRRPLRYRFSGELVMPEGFPAPRACAGRVTVRMKQGRARASQTTALQRRCRYQTDIAFGAAARVELGRPIEVTIGFGGNDRFRSVVPRRAFSLHPRHHAPPAPWIVSLGESYVSGEAGRWAGNSNSAPFHVDALGPDAYHDNATNNLLGPPGHPVPGTSELIPGCHRSRSARVFIRGGVKGLNLACSGALTNSHFAWGLVNPGIKPGVDFSLLYGGQALRLLLFAGAHRVKVVVVGIGGNDFGFGSIVSGCVKAYMTSLNWSGFHTTKKLVYFGSYGPNDFRRYLDWKNWKWVTVQGAAFDKRKYCSEDPSITGLVSPSQAASVRAKVKNAILNAAWALAAHGYKRNDYTIMVQTAPDPIASSGAMRYSQGPAFSLFNPSTWWNKPRQVIGGCGIWDKDLDWIHNTVLPTFNSTFKLAATDAAAATVGFPPYKPRVVVLDVENAFAGRRLCESGTNLVPGPGVPNWNASAAVDRSEWVSQIRTLTLGSPYQLQEGLHPNYWGHHALRSCVRQAYPKALLFVPQSGQCTRSGLGLDTSKTPPEPKMLWY